MQKKKQEQTIKREFEEVVALVMKATEMLHVHHFYLLEAHHAISVDLINQIVARELDEWFIEDWAKEHNLTPVQYGMFFDMMKAFVDKHLIFVQMDIKTSHSVCKFRVSQVQFSLPTVTDPFQKPSPRRIAILAGCDTLRWGQYDDMYKLAVQDFVFETHEAVGVKDETMVMKNSQVQFSASYRIRDVSHDQETVPSNQTTNC